MLTRRRVLFGVVALALPVTGFAVFGTPAMFAGASAPAFPVACKITANLTITPPLTQTGTHTTNRAAVTTVAITGWSLKSCLTAAPSEAPNKGDLPATGITYTIPAAKLGRINGVNTYATGYCPTFVTSSLKAMKGLKFDITWAPANLGASDFTTTKVTPATNVDTEVGFALDGKEVFGSYPEKSLNQITLFIDKPDSIILNSGCSGAQTVSTPTFDNANSVAIL